ncbi:hypothetical protein L208DRAFT_1268344 [Tricholoma matsutake]|nr:hypothetical protein L208DRAFT_1268344 [Tricholoma matsutake 945]
MGRPCYPTTEAAVDYKSYGYPATKKAKQRTQDDLGQSRSATWECNWRESHTKETLTSDNKDLCEFKFHEQNVKKAESNSNADNVQLDPSVPFPPPPVTEALKEIIVRDRCKDSKPSSLEESGCAVCGELVPISQLSHLKAIKTMLGV